MIVWTKYSININYKICMLIKYKRLTLNWQQLKGLKKEEKQQARERSAKARNDKKKNDHTTALPKLALNSQLMSNKDDIEEKVPPRSGSIKSCEILVVPPVHTMKQDVSKGVSCSTFNERMISLMRMKAHFVGVFTSNLLTLPRYFINTKGGSSLCVNDRFVY